MKISGLSFLLALLLCLTPSKPLIAENFSSPCNSATYADNSFTLKAGEFNISQKVYLKVLCKELPRGTHTINTQWIDSKGGLHTERGHTFTIATPKPYIALFSLSHFPKGTLRQIITSGEYEEEQYGKWSVLTFINSDEISRINFIITD